jgi:aromatic ring hydroxylase
MRTGFAFSAVSALTRSAPAIPLLSIWMLDTGRAITSASHHFLERAQFANVVKGGAMTDPKGDRSKASLCIRPKDASDGAVNSHWLTYMPTMRMTEGNCNWSVVGAIRSDAPGLTYVVGRQTNARAVDGHVEANHASSDRDAIHDLETVTHSK